MALEQATRSWLKKALQQELLDPETAGIVEDVFKFATESRPSFDDQWARNLQAVVQFVQDHGAVPSKRSADFEVRRLGSWIATQAVYSKKGAISERRLRRLKESHPLLAARFTERDSSVISWAQNLQLVVASVAEHGCIPSKMSADPTLKRLGYWIITQIAAHKAGSLSKQRLRLLQDSHELVASRFAGRTSHDDAWDQCLQDAAAFILQNERRPLESASDLKERRLGHWLRNQVAWHRRGSLSEHRLAALRGSHQLVSSRFSEADA